jgi:hypothetical protein
VSRSSRKQPAKGKKKSAPLIYSWSKCKLNAIRLQ